MNKARGILLHIKRKSDAGIINAMTVPTVSESTTTVVQAEERRYAPEANQGNAALLEEWKNLMNRGRRRWLSLLEENNHNMTSIAAADEKNRTPRRRRRRRRGSGDWNAIDCQEAQNTMSIQKNCHI